MKSQRLIKLLIPLFMIVLILAMALPALAAPPDQAKFEDSGSFVLANCDGFDLIDEYDGWIMLKNFYDQNGNLQRMTFQSNTSDRIYNSETGFEVRNRFAYQQTFYEQSNTYFIRGAAYEIVVPGYGPVTFDSGLGVYVGSDLVKFAGKYLFDEELLCEAMNQ